MKKIFVAAVSAFLLGFMSQCGAPAAPATDITLPALFSDNMVLQRNQPISVWGKAAPGGEVTVELGDRSGSDVAGGDSAWQVTLKSLPAGGPYTLRIHGAQTIEYQDVLLGEVWVCSGQSNMEMPLAGWGQILNYQQEIRQAKYPEIRLFHVEHATSPAPLADVSGSGWQPCSPTSIPEFSAAGYFFGRNLFRNLNVPIGLIQSTWGGTVAEAWTSGQSLKDLPDFAPAVRAIENGPVSQKELEARYQQELQAWYAQIDEKDPGFPRQGESWAGVKVSTSGWQQMKLPGNWEQAGLKNFDGVVWFRKILTLPAGWAGQDLTLDLGPIDDMDNTYFNGTEVGHTRGYNTPRHYQIPGKLVKSGRNVLAVRVIDTGGGGGLWGEPDQMTIGLPSGASQSLAGTWQYRTALSADNLPPLPQSPAGPNRPTVLYNAMIHPLLPYTIRGVIWYQGESNAGRAYQYRSLFPTMIKDWRQHWDEGTFPFLYVQLANYMATQDQPGESDWAELREAQTMALSLPKTGMAVTIDIGEADDIHPKDKQDVGKRLALIARNKVYGEDITYSGPLYKSMSRRDGAIRISFTHADGGLVAKGGKPLKGFAIAGNDQKFYWANARIAGDQVVVSSEDVPDPVAVRYAWADNPVCNLFNEAGLPASPFRTDDWPGVTMGH